MLGVRASTLAPHRVDAGTLDAIRRLQPTLHRLYDAVANDVQFVTEAIRARIPPCAWQEKELEVYTQVMSHARQKPRLLLPNSIYLQPAADRSRRAAHGGGPVLTVGNVQAGEPFHVDALHRRLRQQQRPCSSPSLPPPQPPPLCLEPGPLSVHCAAIAAAAKLVHPAAPCVAVLSKPQEALAKRTSMDVCGVGDALLHEHGVHTVLYLSMRDLREAVLEQDGSGDLRLGPHRISLVYSRYDFSHPVGQPLDAESADARAAMGRSAGSEGSGSQLAELWAEWETILRMERSSAVISSDIGCRLVHRRGVTYALAQKGGVERFLKDPSEAAAVRAVLPEQWSLRACDHESLEEARALIHEDADGFIAKNVLRPRTGSGATQDRAASGGMPLTRADDIRQLLLNDTPGGSSAQPPQREWYLLYRKLKPVIHDATVVKVDGTTSELNAAVSELAAYGAFLRPAGQSTPLYNACAGVAARTRPADPNHALCSTLGYGALSCVTADADAYLEIP
jgi:hypothetical protein